MRAAERRGTSSGQVPDKFRTNTKPDGTITKSPQFRVQGSRLFPSLVNRPGPMTTSVSIPIHSFSRSTPGGEEGIKGGGRGKEGGEREREREGERERRRGEGVPPTVGGRGYEPRRRFMGRGMKEGEKEKTPFWRAGGCEGTILLSSESLSLPLPLSHSLPCPPAPPAGAPPAGSPASTTTPPPQ